MPEVIQLPDFCTVPLAPPRDIAQIERVYHRNHMRFQFLLEQKRCSQQDYDTWLAALDKWRAYATRMIKEVQ